MAGKILGTIREGGRSYKAGQEEELRALSPALLKDLEKRGLVEGFSSKRPTSTQPESPEGEDDEGLAGVGVADLPGRLAEIDDAEEIARLRSLESRTTADRHYAARLAELQDEED